MGKNPPDTDAWLAEVTDVRPIKGKKAAPRPPEKPGKPAVTPLEISEKPVPPPPVAAEPLHIDRLEAACLSGALSTVDTRTRRRLSRGEIKPAATVDLHGLFLDTAWEELMEFLQDAKQRGHRCVLVIHGKGRGHGPKGDMGVLKFNVPRWLAAHPAVMAFHSARPAEGGSGALYVLLRKKFK